MVFSAPDVLVSSPTILRGTRKKCREIEVWHGILAPQICGPMVGPGWKGDSAGFGRADQGSRVDLFAVGSSPGWSGLGNVSASLNICMTHEAGSRFGSKLSGRRSGRHPGSIAGNSSCSGGKSAAVGADRAFESSGSCARHSIEFGEGLPLSQCIETVLGTGRPGVVGTAPSSQVCKFLGKSADSQ